MLDTFADDAIDPALIMACPYVDFFLTVEGDPFGVFDDGTVHVCYPECTVGAGFDGDRAEPVVGGGEEFRLLLFFCTVGPEGDSFLGEDLAADKVVDGLANKDIAVVLLAEEGVSVEVWAADGGEAVGSVGLVETFLSLADWVDWGCTGNPGYCDCSFGGLDMGVTGEEFVVERVVPEGIGIVAAEPVAPVIPEAAVLGLAGQKFVFVGEWVDAEIVPAYVQDFPCSGRTNFSSSVAVGNVEPVVQAPGKAIYTVLLVGAGESGEPYFCFVRFPVSVRISCKKNVRCRSDEGTIFPYFNASWAD